MDAEHGPGREQPTVIATFDTPGDAERALEALRRAGLRLEAGVLTLREGAPLGGPEAAKGPAVVPGLATGAGVGGLLGGLAGWLLAAIIPGGKSILGPSVLASTLTGAAVGAAGGGLLGALLGLNTAPDEDLFAEEPGGGPVQVTLQAPNPAAAQRIADVLQSSFATRIETPAAPAAPPAPPPPAAGQNQAAEAAAPGGALSDAAGAALAAVGPATGDVVAAETGGPGADVRGALGAATVADRDLGGDLADVAEWRSGGEAARSDGADSGARDLELASPAAPSETAGEPLAPSGDVAAATLGGPDVRPPAVAALADSRDLGDLTAAVGAPGDDWADMGADWRSGGEAARAETGDGVPDLGPVSMPAAPESALSADRGLDAAPAAPPVSLTPPLVSRSALAAGQTGPVTPAASAARDLAAAPIPDANPAGYGDSGLVSRSALLVGQTSPDSPAGVGADRDLGIVPEPIPDANPEGYGDADSAVSADRDLAAAPPSLIPTTNPEGYGDGDSE